MLIQDAKIVDGCSELSAQVQSSVTPLKEFMNIGYHWEIEVERKKFIPSAEAKYKGDNVSINSSIGGNTKTLDKAWDELLGAARTLGVKLNE